MTTEVGKNPLKLSDSLYDKLRMLALVVLPALATLYFGLGQIWNFEYIEEVLGTAVVLETFLGALLGLSTRAHNREKEARNQSQLFITPDGEAYAEFGFNPAEASEGEEIQLLVHKTQ